MLRFPNWIVDILQKILVVIVNFSKKKILFFSTDAKSQDLLRLQSIGQSAPLNISGFQFDYRTIDCECWSRHNSIVFCLFFFEFHPFFVFSNRIFWSMRTSTGPAICYWSVGRSSSWRRTTFSKSSCASACGSKSIGGFQRIRRRADLASIRWKLTSLFMDDVVVVVVVVFVVVGGFFRRIVAFLFVSSRRCCYCRHRNSSFASSRSIKRQHAAKLATEKLFQVQVSILEFR